MKRTTKKRLFVFLAVLVILVAAPAWFAYQLGIIPRIDTLQTFHAPVFSPDGKEIYYLTRNAWGVSWGPGIEFFTPPAGIIVLGDRFLLQSTCIETKETETLHTWRVPHPLKPKSQYRNYLFGTPECELKWDGGNLHYKIGLNFLPDNPPYLTVPEWTTGSWNPATKTAVVQENWKPGYHPTGPWNEQVLSGSWEIVNYKSAALILHDYRGREQIPLRISRSFGSEARKALSTIDLNEYTHRAQLERSRTIRETYADAVAGFKAQGLPEGEAMLRANDEMEKKGFYPKTPRLRATKIETIREGIKVFEISDDEFRFGLFPDIEQAIAKPGGEIHFHGEYITHRDFETSRKLNEHLAAGHTSFIVKTGRGMFLLQIL